MNAQTFRSLLAQGRAVGGHYGRGYQRGIRRHFHGKIFGTEAEHEQWMKRGSEDCRDALGRGYRRGLAGLPPAGRPALRPMIDDQPQKRRQISITDRYSELARKIGDGKLSEGIRRALDAYPEGDD